MGYITTRLNQRSRIGWIPNLAVDPAYHKKGIGRKLIDEAFRNLTLCFGGIFIVHPVKDELVWLIMKSIEEVYVTTCKNIKRTNENSSSKINQKEKKPHPAVEKFLSKIESKSM